MCGIVAAVTLRNVIPILREGLLKLEYRGYDSAGIAVIENSGEAGLWKRKGKVKLLHEELDTSDSAGKIGIAHTRWATHGPPSQENAHPHKVGETIIVHNGIIENYQEIAMLLHKANGFTAISQTDSEVIAAYLEEEQQRGQTLLQAMQSFCKKAQGSYAICALTERSPKQLVVAKLASPLVIGFGVGEHFVASDSLALQQLTQSILHLEDGDIATIGQEGVDIFDHQGNIAIREQTNIAVQEDAVSKNGHRHFMQKEIFEQPKAIDAVLDGITSEQELPKVFNGDVGRFAKCRHIQMVACGTSYHAGLMARNWFAELLGFACQVDIASEFRYRRQIVHPDTLFVTISQSGETADTLAALQNAKRDNYLDFLTICNVPESSLARLSTLRAFTKAGPEIGVASTKAFITQATVLLLLVATFAKSGISSKVPAKEIISWLHRLPGLVEELFTFADKIKEIAKVFEHKHSSLFVGRGEMFPLALEGALKLKELSYIHAEAYPAGELKHGPLALVDDEMPVVALVANNDLQDKVKSNLKEISARDGELIVFADRNVNFDLDAKAKLVQLPSMPAWLAPIAYVVPMQMLAYYVAVLKGTDVDQPRNLAKSVTVE